MPSRDANLIDDLQKPPLWISVSQDMEGPKPMAGALPPPSHGWSVRNMNTSDLGTTRQKVRLKSSDSTLEGSCSWNKHKPRCLSTYSGTDCLGLLGCIFFFYRSFTAVVGRHVVELSSNDARAPARALALRPHAYVSPTSPFLWRSLPTSRDTRQIKAACIDSWLAS